MMATCYGDMVLLCWSQGRKGELLTEAKGVLGTEDRKAPSHRRWVTQTLRPPQLVLLNALVIFRVRSLRACLAGSVFPDY